MDNVELVLFFRGKLGLMETGNGVAFTNTTVTLIFLWKPCEGERP